MKSLLESKDLLSELRVKKAYWLMVKKSRFGPHHIIAGQTCSKCKKPLREVGEGNCPVADSIPGSRADVAFQMRDACRDNNIWLNELIEVMCEDTNLNIRPNGRTVAKNASPKQWIIAAVRIWEAKK